MFLKSKNQRSSATHLQPGERPPAARLVSAQDGNVLRLGGCWTIHTLGKAEQVIGDFANNFSGPGFTGASGIAAVNLEELSGLDTSGAMLINMLRRPDFWTDNRGGKTAFRRSRGAQAEFSGARAEELLPVQSGNQAQLTLLNIGLLPEDLSDGAGAGFQAGPGRTPFIKRALNSGLHYLSVVGALVFSIGESAKGILGFFGLFLVSLAKNLAAPGKIRWTALVYHMGQAGVGAIPIVALLSFLIGTVLAYMTATQLAIFGAEIYVVKLLEVAVMREMGVLITAILVAGRSGSSYTAQIGSMVANQEIDAMRSMGMDPMHMLVVPRVAALTLMLPILVLVADVAGIIGGLAAVWLSLDISPTVFLDTLQRGMSFQHCVAGLVKAPFFAVAIGCVGCFFGFQADGSSASVGRMTTRAVVESIFIVIMLDAVFALFFSTVHF